MPCGKVRAFFPCPVRQRTWPAARRRPAQWVSLVLLFALGTAFLKMLLHHGFLAGLQLEDAAEGINVLAGDGLEDYAVALLHEVDARAGLNAEPPADARGDNQLSFGCNVGGIHNYSVISIMSGTNTNVRQELFCKIDSQCVQVAKDQRGPHNRIFALTSACLWRGLSSNRRPAVSVSFQASINPKFFRKKSLAIPRQMRDIRNVR